MHELRRRTRPSLVALTALLSLAIACSSGSGSSPTDPGGWTVSQVESASFQLVNDAHGSEGIDPPLVSDPTLAAIARGHSEAMRDQGFFSHTNPLGQGFADRLRAAGVTFTAAAENLARVENIPDPAGYANQQFLGNPPHRHNILDPQYTHLGVGVARQGDTWWITQLYIRR